MRTKLTMLIACAVVVTAIVVSLDATGRSTDVSRQSGPDSPSSANLRPNGEATGESEGQQLIRQAEQSLRRQYTIAAQVTQTAHLFGQDVIGSGAYYEQHSNQGLLFRLELNVQARDDERASSVLQVCNGHYLWMYRKLMGSENLSRIDLAFVQRRLDETGQTGLPIVDKWPGMGGLSKWLRSFDKAFLFEKPEAVELQADFPAWKVEGRWRPEMLARALPDRAEEIEQGRGVPLEELPKHLPNAVILFLGKDDKFPYSVAFYRLSGSTTDVKPRPSDQPIVRINMTKVRFNRQIHAAQFVYKPGDLEFVDVTEPFLQKLGVQ